MNEGTTVYAVNSSSVVTGYFEDSLRDKHGFTWANGSFETFDVNGSQSETVAYWLNDKGVSVGVYDDSGTGAEEGFLYKPSGKTKTFDGAGGNSIRTIANGINNKGVIAGGLCRCEQSGPRFCARERRHAHGIRCAKCRTGSGQGTFAYNINDKGAITGFYFDARTLSHGYVRAPDGTLTQFDIPGSNSGASPDCVNDKGSITGDYEDVKSAIHGFVRAADGTVTTFDAPDAAQVAGKGTHASCINNRGEIAGWYADTSGVFHGYLRSKDGSIAEFDAPNGGTGAMLGTFPTDINRDGVIVGYYRDNNRVVHGFLLVP
ncbi:MAG: hypothetical protein WDM89_21510 [Rhizomicrobium sp.]